MNEPIPQGFWLLVTFGSWIIPGLLGYRLGLRSQRHVEMLKAKNAIFAEIDKVRAAAESLDNLRPLLRGSQAHLDRFVFSVCSQLRSEKRRARIMAAWSGYQKLDMDVFPTTFSTSNDPAAIAKARARMTQPLKDLRDEINDT